MLRSAALSRLAVVLVLAAAVLASACESLEFAAANLPALVGPYERHAGVAYGAAPWQRLDVYQPLEVHRRLASERTPPPAAHPAAPGRPVVVFWYGGGWTSGSRGSYRFVGAALARAGYVAMLPDYRLYPPARFPEFVDDAARALVWAHAHAAEYGGDPARLFVMGHSAGAHQAAMLAFDPRQLRRAGGERRWIRGFIGLSGPYALVPNSPVLDAIFAAPWTPRDWQPAGQVDAAAPPSILFHGLDDRLVDPAHARTLDAALRAAGVPSELHLYEGLGHVDTLAALSLPARGRAPVLAAIGRFIERTGPSP